MSSRSLTDLAYDLYTNYWRDAKMNSNEEANTDRVQTSEEIVFNHNGQGDSVYHAIYVPLEDEREHTDHNQEDASDRIYRDKITALKYMKSYRKARLKTFSCHEDAKHYALHGGEKETIATITINNDEKASKFKGPKPQELVAFRKLIENGDLEAVKNIVWKNPRYLVSSGDTPAILQEGCRYNALHTVASKCQTNTSQMCELILNTVGNPDFVKLLYGEEDCKSYVDRAHILLDLYLNTPDKGLYETPLHFAAKYGLKDVVRVLVSYSQCIKNLPNKYEQTPAEVICSRKCQEDETLKRDIHALLEDQYYVPVLRSEDNTLQPIIGNPFSPNDSQLPFSPKSPQIPFSPTSPKIKIDPTSPRVEVRAFAGPMTKPQAVEFRRKWKTPPRMNLNFSQRRDTSLNDSFNTLISHQDSCTRLNDSEKGLERVGRDLAEECHVSWKEFWPFLNDFADFRCNEGLARLEKFLENRFNDACRKDVETIPRENNSNNSSDEMHDLCAKLEAWSLQLEENSCESDEDEEYYTPPSSPALMLTSSQHDSDCDDEMCLADGGSDTFIEGSEPTKTDFDVYNAISGNINAEVYPFVYRWRHEMQLIMENDDFDCNSTFLTTRRRLLMTPEKPRISKC